MGRQGRPGQSRQARRAAQRRQPPRQGPAGGQQPNWPLVGALGAVLAAILIFGILFAKQAGILGNATPTPSMTANSVGGIGCNANMTVGYHVHQHLTVLIKGKQFQFSPDVGHYYDHDCLFWVHKHTDENGLIHLESPAPVKPTLKAFFDIARLTVGQQGVPNITPGPGEQRKVWVNMKPYSGDPLSIPLVQHTDITIEIGPPFSPPRKFPFAKYQV